MFVNYLSHSSCKSIRPADRLTCSFKFSQIPAQPGVAVLWGYFSAVLLSDWEPGSGFSTKAGLCSRVPAILSPLDSVPPGYLGSGCRFSITCCIWAGQKPHSAVFPHNSFRSGWQIYRLSGVLHYSSSETVRSTSLGRDNHTVFYYLDFFYFKPCNSKLGELLYQPQMPLAISG